MTQEAKGMAIKQLESRVGSYQGTGGGEEWIGRGGERGCDIGPRPEWKEMIRQDVIRYVIGIASGRRDRQGDPPYHQQNLPTGSSSTLSIFI
jgi:hypothetical protein